MKKSFIIILVIILALFAGCSKENTNTPQKEVHTADKVVMASASDADHTKVVFEIQDYGDLMVETYPECAPETVSRFLELVKMGYYDGMTFDKLNPGFSLETSNLTALSSGEVNETITGEFAKNGYSNDLPLSRGTLVMCHLPDEYNSATSKFMILLSDDLNIDGTYAGFAKITADSYIFDSISSLPINADGTLVSPIVMKKVYIAE